MAVAVKNPMETGSEHPMNRFAVGSLAGGLYVLASLVVIFYGIPALWSTLPGSDGSAVAMALRIVVMVLAGTGATYLGQRLLGENPPQGLRAGVFAAVVGAFVILLILRNVGGMLEGVIQNSTLGLSILGGLGVVLLSGLAMLFFKPRCESMLVALEAQGWFSMTSYKRSQGQRVRRGTILGILVIAACGVYTLLSHNTLGKAGSAHLEMIIPFSGGSTIRLLPDLKFTVPILLVGVALWFAFRFVNYPTFADFLIATEAELNKVSWTTRKRLVQDTIVVLTTMAFLTVFLFFVDVAWVWILSHKPIQVLQTGDGQTTKKARELDW